MPTPHTAPASPPATRSRSSAQAGSFPASAFPQYDQGAIGWSFFGKNTTLTGGPAPVRAYIEQLLPAVLDGTVNPGKVFDRTVSIEDTPKGYAAMDARESLKVMIRP